MEVEENEKKEEVKNENKINNISEIVPTNDTNSYIKIIKELNYDILPKYEYFNFKKENYIPDYEGISQENE